MQKNTGGQRNAPRRRISTPKPPKQLKAWQLVVIDIILTGICLCVFALFDHVIPSGNIIDAKYTPPQTISLPTTPPSPTDAPAVSATEVPAENQPEATTAPVAAPSDAVGDFSAKFAGLFTDGEVIQTATSYQSANLNITIRNIQDWSGANFKHSVWIEDIYVRNISCLRTVFARDKYGKSITEDVVSMSQRTGSICGINSDYYGFGNAGIVIRNGEIYRSTFEPGEQVLVIYKDGTMKAYQGESDLDVAQAMADGAWQSFSFGPSLLDENGELLSSYSRTNHDPRTIIGMVEPGHYMFIVVDGRQGGYSEGFTYRECAQFCYDQGLKVAYNLDGGRTSQMTYLGEMLSSPYKDGRNTSDLVIIVDQADA